MCLNYMMVMNFGMNLKMGVEMTGRKQPGMKYTTNDVIRR